LRELLMHRRKANLKLDYDKESGIVSNQGELLFKVVEERSAHLPTAKDYTIQSMEGKNLLMLVYNDFYDIRTASQSNPTGRVIYYDVVFFNEVKDRAEVGYNLFMGHDENDLQQQPHTRWRIEQ
jgi:hypothetical protein